MAILKSLNKEGKTIIMVTHENEVAAHAGRVIHMRDGKVISDERSKISSEVSKKDGIDKIIDAVLSRSEKKAREIEFLDYLRQAAVAMLSHKMRS